jgi:VCBS repeat-containing protein
MRQQKIFRLVAFIIILSLLSSALGAPQPARAAGNYALQFNGSSQYVTFGQATTTLGVTNFTLEAWVKRASGGTAIGTGTGGLGTGSYPSAYPVLTKGRGEAETPANLNTNFFLGIATTGVIAADFEDTANGTNHPVIGTATIPIDNAWHHIAATYDGQTWRLYRDGTLDQTLTLASPFAPEATSIQHAALGTAMNSSGTPSGYFSGIIEDARVWNVVRTGTEIQTNMNSEAPSGTGLRGRWDLNEGAGTTAANAVSGGPAGTLVNTPTWVDGYFTPIPVAPSDLTAALTPPGNIGLAWADHSDNEAAFQIERSTDGGATFSPLTSVGANITTFTDTLLLNSTQYCYRLRATSGGGSSEYTNTACATTLAAEALDLGAGNAYVSFGDPAALDLAQFTIETWFKRTGAGTANTTGSGGIVNALPLVTHGSPQGDGSNVDANWLLVIDDASDVIGADFEDMATGLNHPVYGTTTIANDVWYHAAATFDGAAWRLYLNGELETMLAVAASPRSDSIQQAALGAMIESNGAWHGHFQGVLDEARVWNYARTPAQILSTINAQVTAPQTGLVGRWALDDGGSPTVSGSAGTSFNGTIMNTGATWASGAPFDIPVDTTPPAAPAGLTATPAAQQLQVTLGWTANSEPDLAGYNVYRSTTSPVTIGTPLNGALLTSPAYVDTSVSSGMGYYYAVSAVDLTGNQSALSTEASAITPVLEALDLGSASAYVSLGDNADLSQFTLETWLRWDGAGSATSTGTGGVSLEPVITNGTAEAETAAADINYFFGVRGTDGVLCADFEEAQSGAEPGQNHPVCGATPLATGVWYHAAVTYDGATWRLYLNGNLNGELAVGQPVNAANTSQLAFGTSMRTTNERLGYFNGALDEVRIWSYARSTTEIHDTINAKITIPQTGLVGRWGLDEGSGTVINDASGNAIQGAIGGSGYSWIPGAPFNLVVDAIPPAAPTGLMAAAGPARVTLEWTANTEPDLAGYNIYRSTVSPVTAGTPLNGALLTSPGFTDSTAIPGTTYFYAVEAVDQSYNRSALSAEVYATPEALPPDAYGLDLGGTSYVTFGDPDKLDLAAFTIETWFMRTGAGTPNQTGSDGIASAIPLVTHGSPESDGSTVDANWVLVINDASDVIAADFEDNNTGLNHPVSGVTPITEDVWHHAAATYDGTTWRLYLDGNLEATLVVGATPRSDTIQKAALGTMLQSNGTTANGRFQGVLDEARVWNYALSEVELLANINSQLTAGAPGLVARWGFSEGSGTAVGDSTTTPVAGTIVGTGYAWVAGAPFNLTVNQAPAQPVLVSPANGAANIGVPANLSVTVSDPESEPLDVTFYGRPLNAAAGPDFSIVIIPDAQFYASTYPSIYNAQMQWVVDNQTANNIVFVGSLGDNVNTAANIPEWTNADAAYDILDAANVPYGLTAGNHDGAPGSTTNFNTYFGVSRFTGKPSYGGHYGSDNDNHYALFEVSGLKFIVIFIEYDDSMTSTGHLVLQWANSLLATNSDRRAIVISHNVLGTDASYSFTSQGSAIYNALKANPNLFMILGGHLDTAGRRVDTESGHTVYSMRSDYQNSNSQQSGYLRILGFSPANDTISVRTYSPTQDIYYPDTTNNNFDLAYDMGGSSFEIIGTQTGVASGSAAAISWSGLNPLEQYEWYAVATDGVRQTTSATWSFTTGSAANSAPVITEGDTASVSMSEDGAPTAFNLTLNATDANPGDTLTWSISSAASHGTATASGTGALKVIGYTPAANYNGSDSFVVQVSDGTATDTITVNVTITAVNDAPVITAQAVLTTPEDTALTVTLADLMVTDPDNTYPTGFSLALGAGSNYTFSGAAVTPAANFNGVLAVPVTVNDGSADSNTFSLSITVTAVNDAPVLAAIGAKAVEELSLLTFTATATDVDVPVDTLTFSLADGVGGLVPSGAAIGSATGVFAWTPTADQGPDVYTFEVCVSDGTVNDCETITVSVTEGNLAPEITEGVSVSVTMTKNGAPTPFSLTLHATDGNAGDTLTWSIATAAANGMAAASGTGVSKTIGYTPNPNYTGSDSFVVQVSDGAASDSITVNVTILDVHSLALVPGWNLVSFNVHPSDTDIADVLAPISGQYSLVYAWVNGAWQHYDPQAYPNTLAALDETMGFWIYMNQAATLTVTGTTPVPSGIGLNAGWNLVSFPGATSEALPGAFTNHGVDLSNLNLVMAMHANETTDPWLLYDPAAPSYVNDLTALDPGWGYWVSVDADDTWTVP